MINALQIGRVLTTEPPAGPPIKSMMCWNANPVTQAPETDRIVTIANNAIAALNSGLITANLSLSKVMNQSALNPDQNLKVGSLLTKP